MQSAAYSRIVGPNYPLHHHHEEDLAFLKAFALINALDEGQRKQAILNYKVADLVLGPGQDGKTIQPEGINGGTHQWIWGVSLILAESRKSQSASGHAPRSKYP
jgi:hypothetical protein